MNIYFVRHGETNANANGTVPGKDEHLSDVGRMQAAQIAERLQNLDIEAIIATDSIRTEETAKPTSEALNLPIEVSPAFGEMYEPTKYVGLSDESEEILAYRKQRNGAIDTVPDWTEEDGESFADLFRRFTVAEEFLQNRTEENIVVFSHAYYLKGLVAKLLRGAEEPSSEWLHTAFKIKMSNCGITMFTLNDDYWELITLNDHAHFAE